MPDNPLMADPSPPRAGSGQRPCLVFLHIPKAAGQTLNAILARQYERSTTVVIEDSSDSLLSLASKLGGVSPTLIRGHVPYGVPDQLRIDARYITMLREPVDRVISTYNYIRRNDRHPLHDMVLGGRMSLGDYVRSDINRQEVVDGQTRFVAGQLDSDPDEGTLSLAKQNLERMAAVGLAERFDESVMLFRQQFHWSFPLYVRKNVAPARSKRMDISPAVHRLLQQVNQYDIELYAFAQTLFDDEIRAAGTRFPIDVALFRVVNGFARMVRRASMRGR